MSQQRFLSLPQVQRELGLTAHEVQALLDSGAVPAIRLCGAWRVERALLDNYLDSLYQASPYRAPARSAGSLPGSSTSAVASSEPVADGWAPASAAATATLRPRPEPEPVGAFAPVGPPGAAQVPSGLSGQQERVLLLLAEGLSNAEIAQALHLEITTVKSHVSRMLQRLGLRNREGLIVYAWRLGLPRRQDQRHG